MRSSFSFELFLPFNPNLKNGPIPRLIDPPIQENGINIMHTQKLKKRAITTGNLYKKFNLPVKHNIINNILCILLTLK